VTANRGFVARLGALSQIVFATLIAGLSTAGGFAEPDFVPRPIVLFAAYALPGVIGLIGIDRRRPALLLAAAGASAIGAFVAFSGVTLIFLVPATLMAAGSMGLSDGAGSRRSVAVEAGRALLVLLLLVGAGASAILITDERCWDFRETPQGRVYLPAPNPSPPMLVVPGSGYGCSSGLISARGVGLGLALGATAIGLAILPVRRRRVR
jgi:hypothetical protein